MENGLDMGKTIEWYNSVGTLIPSFPEAGFRFPVENRQLIELRDSDLEGLLKLFPQTAIDRSILRKVIGMPKTWFKAKCEEPTATTNLNEAISPTAIAPSYVEYKGKDGKLDSTVIQLFQLPEEIPAETRRTILGEGFIHELGHSIIAPALYGADHNLILPDKRIVNAYEYAMQIADAAEKHVPMSRYALTYRNLGEDGKAGKFKGETGRQMLVSVSEELAESVAAYLLGFAYSGNEARNRNPFADRPELKEDIGNFLNARKE